MSASRNAQTVPPGLLDIEEGTRASETSGSEVRWAPRDMPDPETPTHRPAQAFTDPGHVIQQSEVEPHAGLPVAHDTVPPSFCSEGAEVTKVFQPNLGDLGIRRSDMAPPDPGAHLDVDLLPDVDELPDDFDQLMLSAPQDSFNEETSTYSHEQLGLLSKETSSAVDAEEEVTVVCPAPSEVRYAAPRRRASSHHPAAGSEVRVGAGWMQLGFPAWAVGAAVAVVLGVLLLGVLALGPPGLRSELVRSRAAALFPSLVDTHNAGSASAPDAPAPATPSSASKPTPIRLMIAANPPETRLFLDDQPITNPLDSMREPEGTVHVLRAEAPGRSAITRIVTLDRDLTIFLELGYGAASR